MQGKREDGPDVIPSADGGTAIYTIRDRGDSMSRTAVPDPATVLTAYLREAVAESKLAYRFRPNSYSFAAMNACIAADQALEVLIESLEASGALNPVQFSIG
jgi:hypothetical protein